MRVGLGDIYSVLKLRIGMAIALSAVAGAAVTAGPAMAPWQIALLAFSVLMASGSAGAFNHLFERDLDTRMKRTRSRPFARGALRAGPAWLLAILGLLVVSVGAAGLVLGPLVGLYVFLGAFVYGVVYTVWLKRRTALNIVIGGLSGSFAVLAGAAAVDPAPAAVPTLLAVVLFLWTPPHFWSLAAALRDDYAAAGVPMLPVVVGEQTAAWIIFAHVAALVGLSLVPAMLGLGWIYLGAAAIGGALFVWRSLVLVRAPTRANAMANFHASLVQLSLLLAGAIVDRWV